MRLEPIMEFYVDRGVCLKGFEVLMPKKSHDSDLELYFTKVSDKVDYLIFVNHCYGVKSFYQMCSPLIESVDKKLNVFLNINHDTLYNYCEKIREVVNRVESDLNNEVRIFLEVTERERRNGKSRGIAESLRKSADVLGRERIVLDDFGRGLANFELLDACIKDQKIAGVKVDVTAVPYNVCKEVVKHVLKKVNYDFFIVFEKIEDEKTLVKFVKSLFVKERSRQKVKDNVRFYYQGFVFKGKFQDLFLTYTVTQMHFPQNFFNAMQLIV